MKQVAPNLTAVLGPTNTGKTHLAIERMLGHDSGVIGLPLRLLAREVYDKIVARAGAMNVALITGEEKIKPPSARYHVCTVEAMPSDSLAEFVAVDEIQLAADPERGHVFTDRLFNARGRSETLLLGSSTMRDAIRDLLPGANIVSRARLSKLTWAGQKKVSRLPRRSAIVAFSAAEVYEIAELVRRQRGGAAVVLGALSPKTRNAQVELYQNGDVDFLVATDAIGMGLNLDVDHVAFAATRKFDGQQTRELTPAEIGQIAGRAGRHMNDGTFGVTARIEPFGPELVNALESHEFEPVRVLQWRNRNLDYSSLAALKASLQETPVEARLIRARSVDDVIALETLSREESIARSANSPAAIRRLWDVCQVPDYRKVSPSAHADLLADIYRHLTSDSGLIDEDWFAAQVSHADRADGDIDTLANRIAHIRTWTFVSHRAEWLRDPEYWQKRTREIEDKLSDALHERLTMRFVDKRTSALMKSLRDKDELFAEIAGDGAIEVESHFVGRLRGFRFTPDTRSGDVHGKAARHAASRIVTEELARRAERLTAAPDTAFALSRNGEILWEEQPVGRLEKGETALTPVVQILVDEHLGAPDRERITARLDTWTRAHIGELLAPLIAMRDTADITGLARGVAFRLTENLGVLKREDVSEEIRTLDQDARAQLRKYGVRFGAFNIYLPLLLKPAAADLTLLLWAIHAGQEAGVDREAIPEPPRQGLTSAAADPAVPETAYRMAGFHHCGKRVVRIDMLERLADMIRPLVAWREGAGPDVPRPEGATGNGGFRVQPDMMSIVGCSGEDFAVVLQALGFRRERKPLPTQPQPADADAPLPEAEPAQSDAAGSTQVQEAVQPLADDEPAQAQAEPQQEAQLQDGSEQRADADAEPQFEEIWRPRRKHAHPDRPPRRDTDAKAGKRNRRHDGKGKPPREGRPKHARKPDHKPRQEKAPDPDSPFAALKDLKRELESGVKG